MRGFCLAAACGLLLPGPILRAQTSSDLLSRYRQAVQRYQSGDVDGSVRALVAWPFRDITQARDAVGRPDRSFAEAAAMLHTEIAGTLLLEDHQKAVNHLGVAEDLVRRLPANEREFQAQWYVLAASIFLAESNPRAAQTLVDRGLGRFPRDVRLHVAAGIVEEMLAHLTEPECVTPGCSTHRPRNQTVSRLLRAAAFYGEALDLDPGDAEAHLRRGRVLFLSSRRKDARVDFDAVSASDPRLNYLKHLFLGALDVSENDLPAASREFETATAIGPQTQTPRIALSSIQQQTGLHADARATVAVLQQLPPDADDPWWTYQNGGIDQRALVWLRDRIRQ